MKKIPLFQSFKDVNQGFEKLIDIIEMIDGDAKIQMIIWYGCIIQTLTERDRNIRKELDDVDALMRKKIAE